MHVIELSWIEPTTAMRCLADRPYLTFLDSAANDAAPTGNIIGDFPTFQGGVAGLHAAQQESDSSATTSDVPPAGASGQAARIVVKN